MAAATLFLTACSEDDDVTINELEGLRLVTTLTSSAHSLELYTTTGTFQTGYNAIHFQIRNTDGSLIKNATASWTPVMHMTSMSHSCPASPVSKRENTASTYSGFIVFQMASNNMEYWDLSIDYTVDGASYTAKQSIKVTEASKRVVESFKGVDAKRYVIALAEPSVPKVGINDMKAVVYQMESMLSFTPVSNYKLRIDPRMPGMNNHSSPNNVDLLPAEDTMYHGKLSLTMTGYWKVNLQLENADGTVLKGEEVTESNESSSLYFEIEF